MLACKQFRKVEIIGTDRIKRVNKYILSWDGFYCLPNQYIHSKFRYLPKGGKTNQPILLILFIGHRSPLNAIEDNE
jgi:hypothetical protein